MITLHPSHWASISSALNISRFLGLSNEGPKDSQESTIIRSYRSSRKLFQTCPTQGMAAHKPYGNPPTTLEARSFVVCSPIARWCVPQTRFVARKVLARSASHSNILWRYGYNCFRSDLEPLAIDRSLRRSNATKNQFLQYSSRSDCRRN